MCCASLFLTAPLSVDKDISLRTFPRSTLKDADVAFIEKGGEVASSIVFLPVPTTTDTPMPQLNAPQSPLSTGTARVVVTMLLQIALLSSLLCSCIVVQGGL